MPGRWRLLNCNGFINPRVYQPATRGFHPQRLSGPFISQRSFSVCQARLNRSLRMAARSIFSGKMAGARLFNRYAGDWMPF